MTLRVVLICLGVFMVSSIGMSQTNETSRVREIPSFTVIGIECRTTNAKEMSEQGCIGRQWGRLMSEGLLAKIPDRVDQDIVALYTDYASDKDGEYTYVLGARVKADATAPAGMVKKTVPAARYAVFTSEKGPAPQVVPQTWMRIWKTPKGQPGGDRAYQTDFELYDRRAADPNNSEVDVYVGIH